MNEEYFPGKGCACWANDQSECACNADWTDPEIYQLRAENERLKAEAQMGNIPYAEAIELKKENERLVCENVRLKAKVQILKIDNAHIKAKNSSLHFK
jgi:hypothetical protein